MPTIREVAKAASVSPGAVSRILNHDITLNVSEPTRQRVLAIAQEMNYIKKSTGKQVKSTLTIGILQWYSIRQELEDPYYLSIRLGAEKYCSEHSINVVRAFRGDADYSALKGVNGLICIGKFAENEIETFSRICPNFILVDMHTTRILHNCMTLDFLHATTDALDYLISLGHKKVGYLGGKEYISENTVYFEQRKSVFEAYCKEKGLCYEPYVFEASYSIESGYQMMSELLQQKDLPTAIFTASDAIALGAIRALNERGLHVPNDISIIGFDNINASAYTNPPLTTVNAPTELMGEYAANFIMTSLSLYRQYHIPMQMMLPCSLIKRGSCRDIYNTTL